MDKEKISVFRLYSGDIVIGEKTQEPDVSLANPREIAFMPTMSGSVSVGFRPLCMFGESCKKSVSLRTDQVMLEVPSAEIPKELVDGYMSEVSGIKLASAADVPDLTGKPKAGSFSL